MRPTARVFDGTALVTHALHTVSQPGRHAAIDFAVQRYTKVLRYARKLERHGCANCGYRSLRDSHDRTCVRKSRLRHPAINIEAIVAYSSRTRRNPKLLGGLPTAQPPPLASRMKSVTKVRCSPSTTRTPQLAIDAPAGLPIASSDCRMKQVLVHSQTFPDKSSNPYSFAPKAPVGCGR